MNILLLINNLIYLTKELDYETGLYYYGARYYDAKISLWLNTDPLSGYNPILETEHYIDGQHNGGVFNPMNMATYSYTYQNPILYIDPNGKQNKHWIRFLGGLQMIGGAVEIVGSGVGEYFSGGTATPLMVPLFLNGLDNAQAGARQLWTGEVTNTLLHTGTKKGAEFLGASEQNAEKIATAVDISTIFLGNGYSAYKAMTRTGKASEFSVANSKFDYFFGKVKTGNSHNVQRSAQNLKDLTTLGIKSKDQLLKVFGKALSDGTEVKTIVNQHGTTITKSIEIGKKGKIEVSFLYEAGNNTPKVTTITPKIYKQ